MNATSNFNIPLTFKQVVSLVKQLPKSKQAKLVSLIQEEEELSKEQILQNLKEDYIALQKGTLVTRPASEFLQELKDEELL
ncbi:MAG: hypothetical protein U5M51_10590 [Emticicia sp.]|nr:hypothetical protein [Emticicia sp.]